MTREEKIAWLRRYAEAGREVDRLAEEVRRWASRAEKMTVSYSAAPGGGDRSSPQERALDAIGELQEEMVAQMGALAAVRAEVEGAVAALENEAQREVLRLRYLKLDARGGVRRLEVVAAEAGYSLDYVKHLHRGALGAVRVPGV